jgi:hypothetical protein
VIGHSRARRDADLFYADLVGAPVRRRSAASEDVDEQTSTCGFFGTGTWVVSEAILRNNIVVFAAMHYGAWHEKGKHALLECDDKAFGWLITYTLGYHIDEPADLTALQTAAVKIPASEADPPSKLMTGSGVDSKLLPVVKQSVKDARASAGNTTAWSAFWVTAVVRAAAIATSLEGKTFGRDKLLKRALGHREYTLAAYNRTIAKTNGTYHAFDPKTRKPQRGDIIVQDRQAKKPRDVFTFSDVPKLSSPRETHGDIVIAVDDTEKYVTTVGGNVDDSVRLRYYPLDGNGFLVVDEKQRFTQEDNWQMVSKVPERTCPDPAALHARNTLRIFALLSPVAECRP